MNDFSENVMLILDNVSDVRREINKAKIVNVWVEVTEDEGKNLRISKAAAKRLYKGYCGCAKAKAFVTANGRLIIG